MYLVNEIGDARFDGVLEGHVRLQDQDGEEEEEKTQVRNQSTVRNQKQAGGGAKTKWSSREDMLLCTIRGRLGKKDQTAGRGREREWAQRPYLSTTHHVLVLTRASNVVVLKRWHKS